MPSFAQFLDRISLLQGMTPLHHAARQGKIETAESLLCSGADINAQDFQVCQGCILCACWWLQHICDATCAPPCRDASLSHVPTAMCACAFLKSFSHLGHGVSAHQCGHAGKGAESSGLDSPTLCCLAQQDSNGQTASVSWCTG